MQCAMALPLSQRQSGAISRVCPIGIVGVIFVVGGFGRRNILFTIRFFALATTRMSARFSSISSFVCLAFVFVSIVRAGCTFYAVGVTFVPSEAESGRV